MSDEFDRLTAKQAEALRAEVEELEGPRRTEVVAAIKKAREFGDLSENFEYHAAKNEQGLLEARIRTLRHRLESSEIVEVADHAIVSVGSAVEIETEDGKRMTIEISNLTKPGAVSPTAPLGEALMGAREGDEVQVAAPRGPWKARVRSIRAA